MTGWLAVMAGGAIGSAGRYWVSQLIVPRVGGFPWATLAVNVVGGLAMGLLVGWLARSGNETLRLLLGVGVLGGFTTFSAFGIETVQMIERGAHSCALVYVVSSVIGSVGFTMVGYALVRP